MFSWVNPQIPLVNLEYWYTWHSNHRAFSLIDGFDTVQWDIIIENKFHLTNGDIQSDPHFLWQPAIWLWNSWCSLALRFLVLSIDTQSSLVPSYPLHGPHGIVQLVVNKHYVTRILVSPKMDQLVPIKFHEIPWNHPRVGVPVHFAPASASSKSSTPQRDLQPLGWGFP